MKLRIIDAAYHRNGIDGKRFVRQFHQRLPRAEHRVVFSRRMGEIFAPLIDHRRPQVGRCERQEIDRCFRVIGVGRCHAHQVIADALGRQDGERG